MPPGNSVGTLRSASTSEAVGISGTCAVVGQGKDGEVELYGSELVGYGVLWRCTFEW